ncbi:MAG: NB-ARC domain-containing protein, partial [Hyphomicrobiaceae bacterium]|nr:NB-ARC domain-containing protein [Hyphomicrobiaceae bacterium]
MGTRFGYKDLLDGVIILAAIDQNGRYVSLEATSLNRKFEAVECHFEKGKTRTAVVSADQPEKSLPKAPPYRLIKATDFDDLIERLRTTPHPYRKVQEDINMPVTPNDGLFGRNSKLELLEKAWSNGNTNVLTFVAPPGTGKTALVNHWISEMRDNDWRGAEQVYIWSFYGQGTENKSQVTAQSFFKDALSWFGYSGENIEDDRKKGLKLAELVASKRTLLVLDGLEPLQYPPGEMQGKLKDPGLNALFRQLSGESRGLCLITTRTPIVELRNRSEPAVISRDLKDLKIKDGVKLLLARGVKKANRKREEEELRKAVHEVDGNALALNLLGSYITTVHGGDITQRYHIANLQKEVSDLGGHAKRVMASYEQWLGGESHNIIMRIVRRLIRVKTKTSPELANLYIMGLVDRLAPAGAIE